MSARQLVLALAACAVAAAVLWLAIAVHGGSPPPAIPEIARPPQPQPPAPQAQPPTQPSPPQPAPQPPQPPRPAPPTPPTPETIPAARAEREELVARMRESGSGEEPWDGQAEALFSVIGKGPATRDNVGCYVAGCAATFTFPSVAELRARVAEVEGEGVYLAWTGGKRFSEPEILPDGRAVVGLVLYRPD